MATRLQSFSIETGVLANTRTVFDLLGFIIRKAKEARSFQGDCNRLANLSVSLSLSFLEHEDVLNALRSAKDFKECLRDVFLLVTQCSRYDIVHIGWEIFVKGRIKELTERFGDIERSFGVEILMHMKKDVKTTNLTLESMKETLQLSASNELVPQRNQFLSTVQEIDQEIHQREKESKSFEAACDFSLEYVPPNDLENLSNVSHSSSKTADFRSRRVALEVAPSSRGLKDRWLSIYDKICEITLLRKVYGYTRLSADSDGPQLYYVLQDITPIPSLASTISTAQTESPNSWTLLQKIKFCYEISGTVSALHHNHLLIKGIDDFSIRINDTPEKGFRPLVTGIDHLRFSWEVSMEQKYDERFEAPEYRKIGMHTRMTDVWSLGVVLMEILTGEFPYNEEPLERKTGEERSQLYSAKISRTFIPFEEREMDGPMESLRRIIFNCLKPDPQLRPSAASLAQQLFDQMILELANSESDVSDLTKSSAETDASVDDIIKSAREAIGLRKSAFAALRGRDEEQLLTLCQPIEGLKLLSADNLGKLNATEDTHTALIVGLCYLWNVLDLELVKDKTESPMEPVYVFGARAAIPHLDRAAKQGYREAHDGLYRAHKILTMYYGSLINRKDR